MPRARDAGELTLPVLFLHGAYDYTCETIDSRLAEPMRRDCTDLTHDDGVSLFLAGTETTTCTIASCPGDLLPTTAAQPTTAVTDSVNIGPGTYDLWYAQVKGLATVLRATSTPAPEPASLTLLGSALVGLGWFAGRRRTAV